MMGSIVGVADFFIAGKQIHEVRVISAAESSQYTDRVTHSCLPPFARDRVISDDLGPQKVFPLSSRTSTLRTLPCLMPEQTAHPGQGKRLPPRRQKAYTIFLTKSWMM